MSSRPTMPAMEAEQGGSPKSWKKNSPQIPNMPLDEVPDGKDEKGNVEHHVFGAEAGIRFQAEAAFRIWAKRSARWTSSSPRNYPARVLSCCKKGLARLERALGQFLLDLHTDEHGYTEVNPPLMVRDESCMVRRNCQSLPKISS